MLEQTMEQQIAAEIERLRGEFPNTQDLYREVCIVLFFRYGITPTANMLYQYVRKGSMSAPAKALATFWEHLREKSRIQISHPDLPEELRSAAGELVASLWSKAQESAHESLEVFRKEYQAEALEAKTLQSEAHDQYQDALKELESARTLASERAVQIGTLQQELSVAQATVNTIREQLTRGRDEQAQLQDTLVQARREFAAELDKLRASTELGTERLRATEARALLDIDHERTIAKSLAKELEALRAKSGETMASLRAEATGLHQEVAALRQNVGVLEGRLRAEIDARQEVNSELAAARTKLEELIAQVAAARQDVVFWQQAARNASRRQDAAKLRNAKIEAFPAKASASLKAAERKPTSNKITRKKSSNV